MPEIIAKRNPKRCPTHPGALLREDILPALNLPKTAIADALEALLELADQDPLIGVRRDPGTGVASVALYGELQQEVLHDALLVNADRRKAKGEAADR